MEVDDVCKVTFLSPEVITNTPSNLQPDGRRRKKVKIEKKREN